MYNRYFKRIIDIMGAIILIILLLPVFITLIILIRIKLGEPVFFIQKRPGKNEKIYSMFKFRSMTNKLDDYGNLLPDEKRITRFGTFLRKSSLDELPAIINVLVGDMSFIGPRPLLERYLPYYTSRERIRHSVKPGITGLAQISGRNNIPWEQRFTLDVEYVENLSLMLDLKIFIKTFYKVIKKEDVNVIVADNKDIKDLDVERKIKR